ncbi:MAG TPA: ATP-grasp domain-containing protein [Kofleriaceae bacterium]|nr:ATP-grasp domain-containing protein [Kofleriaceae bacterium]
MVVRQIVPLVYEHRMFAWRGRLIAEAPYHDVEPIERPARFASLAHVVESPLFSADIALTAAGEWIVLELGDGRVSTLPPTMDPRALYRALAEIACTSSRVARGPSSRGGGARCPRACVPTWRLGAKSRSCSSECPKSWRS